MTKKPIEAIFLDVDGTLLTSVFTISKKNVEALKRLQKAGVKIFLASGRPFAALAKIVDILSLPSYAIILNGGCIVSNNNEFMYSCEISQECAPAILSIATENGVSPCVYTPSNWFVEKVDDNVLLEINRSEIEPQILPFDQIKDPIIKILFIGKPDLLSKCKEDIFRIKGISCFNTYPEYLEIMSENASKGKARDRLLNHLNISSENVLAIGDGINDISLLRGIGVSVAVENGHHFLKQAADLVTLSNDDDGVAVAIDAIVFNNNDALRRIRRRQR